MSRFGEAEEKFAIVSKYQINIEENKVVTMNVSHLLCHLMPTWDWRFYLLAMVVLPFFSFLWCSSILLLISNPLLLETCGSQWAIFWGKFSINHQNCILLVNGQFFFKLFLSINSSTEWFSLTKNNRFSMLIRKIKDFNFRPHTVATVAKMAITIKKKLLQLNWPNFFLEYCNDHKSELPAIFSQEIVHWIWEKLKSACRS